MSTRDNPLGPECFEFVEYAAPDAQPLHALFQQLGFSAIARHRDIDATLYRQGRINFIVNEEPRSFASAFAAAHGPCCSGFALRVANPQEAYEEVLKRGAEVLPSTTPTTVLGGPQIAGIGGSVLYLTPDESVLADVFDPIAGVDQRPQGYGLTEIDHLTHNVRDGQMDHWANFYRDLFGFHEIKYFDIRGAQTGLRSRAMTAPNGRISIPINESSDPKSQINEYLAQYQGEGVQHIALYSDDIYATVEAMREAEVDFMPTPDTYYEVVDQRIPGHTEDLARMRRNRILIDAESEDSDKQLLQIFTNTCVGPIFFEIIQRKGNEGFGEGNFQALFESIELDQKRRGVL